MMSVLAKAIALGLLTALVGVGVSAIPEGADLETELGLAVLFALRGPRSAPADVVIATIDRESSERLGLPNRPERWPRSLHARLVRSLASRGAQVIAFDIIFAEPREATDDRLFADAIREAGNVVLFEYLRNNRLPLAAGDTYTADTSLAQVSIEQRVPPIPELAQAAAALAPFPLPKVPVKVSQCWLFKSGAGDTPILPVVSLQIYARPYYQDLMRMLRELSPRAAEEIGGFGDEDAATLVRALQQLFRNDPLLAPRLLAQLRGDTTITDRRARAVLAALIDMYGGHDSRFLDYYGPPRSITTVPYYRLLGDAGSQPVPDLHGKAVFVGFSEQLQPEQRDGFYTDFSQPDGLDLSGVEIAATIFANLLEGRETKPLDPPGSIVLILLWGAALGAFCLFLPAHCLVPVTTLSAAAYFGIAYYAFALDGLWLPLVVPLLIQLPQALLSALLWRYLDTRRERQRIRTCFQYYVPGQIVDELTKRPEDITVKGKLVYGVCLATDAEQYTRLSETLGPDRLRLLLNRYYDTLFAPVRRHGGFISDVVGDAMLAIWATDGSERTPQQLRQQACRAALDIVAAVDEFNRLTPDARLPTRLGMHCGDMLLGNVGAGDHYEYRAVGDIVNTATRVEGLNKRLGTRILTACEVVEHMDGIVTREVGSFCFAGKSRPLAIHELVCRTDQLTAARRELHEQFAAALEAFRSQCWGEAAEAFRALLAKHGDDGPSRYYLWACEQYTRTPPPLPWDCAVSLERRK